jgi:hypothetical protein
MVFTTCDTQKIEQHVIRFHNSGVLRLPVELLVISINRKKRLLT